ncbi:uncharacterized protein LOC134261085 [Saccostrea cucullata]|uniref:uncharacterized protein LOC134261085 n=1 Tax=Saccostrea cuccullata TaxID=36930 RepID=UPI002ED5C259
MAANKEPFFGYNFLRALCQSSWELITASRQKIGLLLSVITLALSGGTVAGMAFDRDLRPLQNYNKESCALQASFGLISVGSGIQLLLILYLLYEFFKTRLSKTRVDDYHINVSANFLSLLALTIGMTMYVTLLTSTMDFWYYFLGWDSVAFTLINTFLWFVTEYYHRHAERYLTYREMKDDVSYLSSSEEDDG